MNQPPGNPYGAAGGPQGYPAQGVYPQQQQGGQPGYGPPQGYPQQQAYPQPSGAGGFGPTGAGAGAAAAALDKGFIGAMFDFSFNSYITPKIVKVLYGLWILLAVLVLVGGAIAGFTQIVSTYGSAVLGILQILLSPLAAILVLILGRVYMEVLIVLFKIAEHLGDINRKTKD